jgi:hypothetical protein
MLDVTYTMSRNVEVLKYTENYKTRMEVRRGETVVDGFRSLPGPVRFKPHELSFEHLFSSEISPSKCPK